jgi:hypothetical protein
MPKSNKYKQMYFLCHHNIKLEKTIEQVAVGSFKEYYGIWLGGLREALTDLSKNNQCFGQVPKYKLQLLLLDLVLVLFCILSLALTIE